jgi:probable F420-dependent oxidoreductase
MVSFGVAIPTYGEFHDGRALRDLVQAAEDLGYAQAWFADHVVMPDYAVPISGAAWLEPLAACFVGLGATSRLRVGTDVLVVPYRNPVLVAKMAATADRLSGGRLVLGAGVGYISGEFAALATPPYEERGAITDEYLAVMRALWETEGGVTFAGRYVTLDRVHCDPKPLQRPFPVWVGGNHPRAWRRAADLGDGWHPLFPTPADYATGRAAIEARRAAQGRAAGAFAWSYSCPGTRVLDAPAGPSKLPSYEDVPDLPAEYGYAPPMPQTDDGRAMFVGTPEQVQADVAALVAAGVEHLNLRFFTSDTGEGAAGFVAQLERFAREVAPAFA